MLLTHTLCFLTRTDQVLMLHRRKPPNVGLWNGVGGRIEAGEAPLAGCLREVREETGYGLATARFAGLMTWHSFETGAGGLYLFTAPAPEGEPVASDEGELRWWPRAAIFTSPEVVPNIHYFGQLILNNAPLQVYHFEYQHETIVRQAIQPLPAWLELPITGAD